MSEVQEKRFLLTLYSIYLEQEGYEYVVRSDDNDADLRNGSNINS
jgi:hypothetical protein